MLCTSSAGLAYLFDRFVNNYEASTYWPHINLKKSESTVLFLHHDSLLYSFLGFSCWLIERHHPVKIGVVTLTGNLRLDQVDMNMQLLYLPCFSLYVYQPQHFTTTIAIMTSYDVLWSCLPNQADLLENNLCKEKNSVH